MYIHYIYIYICLYKLQVLHELVQTWKSVDCMMSVAVSDSHSSFDVASRDEDLFFRSSVSLFNDIVSSLCKFII